MSTGRDRTADEVEEEYDRYFLSIGTPAYERAKRLAVDCHMLWSGCTNRLDSERICETFLHKYWQLNQADCSWNKVAAHFLRMKRKLRSSPEYRRRKHRQYVAHMSRPMP